MSARSLLEKLWVALTECWPGSRWHVTDEGAAPATATRTVDVLGEPYTVRVEPARDKWAVVCCAEDGERLRLEYPEAEMGLTTLRMAITRVNELRNCRSVPEALEMAATIRGEQLEILRYLLAISYGDSCEECEDDGGAGFVQRQIVRRACGASGRRRG